MVLTKIYEQYGTYIMFGTVTATLVISLVLTLVAYATLVPGHEKDDGVTGVPEVVVTGEIGRRLPVYSEEEEQSN